MSEYDSSDIDYDLDDCAFNGQLVNYSNHNLYGDMYNMINVDNLFIHAKNNSYSLYHMFNNEEEFVGIFIAYDSFKKVWGKSIPVYPEICRIGNSPCDFVQITEELLDKVKNKTKVKMSLYILRRLLWPDDTSLIATHKRVEFEVSYKVITRLGNKVSYTQQFEVLGYRPDLLFELKHTSLVNCPTICFEIDENNHDDRDPVKEQFRENVLRYYSNNVVRASINRDATFKQIDLCVETAVKKIEAIIKDLTAQYIREIDPEYFMREVDRYNIEREYVSLFYKTLTEEEQQEYGKYIYDHESIGSFLGLKAGSDGRYKGLREKIKENLVVNMDYKEFKLTRKNFSGQKSKKWGGNNKVVYRMTRVGFFILIMSIQHSAKAEECRLAFARIYELALDFAMTMKNRIGSEQLSMEEKKNSVNQRIEQKVDERVKNRQVSKLRKEIKELKEKNKEMKSRIEELEEENKGYLDARNEAINKSAKIQAKYNEEVPRLKSKVNRMNAIINKLKSKVTRMHEIINNLNSKVYRMNATINKMKSKETRMVTTLNEVNISVNKMIEDINKLNNLFNGSTDSSNPQDDLQDTPKFTEANLNKKNMKELKDICRQNKISDFSNKRKAELIAYILSK